MKELTTYHVYHHQPDALSLSEITDRAWLINNAMTYSLVAIIKAANETEALHAAQCKAQERSIPRSVSIQAGNLLRETQPGDVLVADYAAWMVDVAGHLCAVAYTVSQPWKSLRQRSGQQAAVDCLAWSPDGRVLAASASDRRVVLHVISNDEPYRNSYERADGYSIEALAWSPHGSRVAAAHHNGEIHLFQPAPWHSDGSVGSILMCRTEEANASYARATPHCLAWSADGVQIFAGRDDGMLVGWESRTGACLPSRKRHAKAVIALAFSPRSEHVLLTASADATVRIWDRTADQERVYQHTKAVTAAVWSPDGTLVASCEHADPAIHVWHPQTGALVERLPLSISSTELLEVRSLAWSPGGTLLAAGCDDSTIQLIDLTHHRHVHTYRVDARRLCVSSLAWSPAGEFLAAGDGSVGIRIWQVGREVCVADNGKETKPCSYYAENARKAL